MIPASHVRCVVAEEEKGVSLGTPSVVEVAGVIERDVVEKS